MAGGGDTPGTSPLLSVDPQGSHKPKGSIRRVRPLAGSIEIGDLSPVVSLPLNHRLLYPNPSGTLRVGSLRAKLQAQANGLGQRAWV